MADHSATSDTTSVSANNGIKMEPLIDGHDNDESDDYDDIEALEALGLIRTDRDASVMEITEDVEDEGGGMGCILIFFCKKRSIFKPFFAINDKKSSKLHFS